MADRKGMFDGLQRLADDALLPLWDAADRASMSDDKRRQAIATDPEFKRNHDALQARIDAHQRSKAVPASLPDREQLEQMSFGELVKLRKGASPEAQALLGPYEHRAYAREVAQDEPLKAAVSLPFMIPGYTASKALGFEPNARSPASLGEMSQAFKGLGEGMLSHLTGAKAADPVAEMLNPKRFRMGVDGALPKDGMLRRLPYTPSSGVRG